MSYQKYTTFRDAIYATMVAALEERCQRLISFIAPLDITVEDVKNLLVKDEDRETLFRASSLCDLTVRNAGTIWPVPLGYTRRVSRYTTTTIDPSLSFNFVDRVQYVFPDYSKEGPIINQAPEVAKKINEWIKDRLAIGLEFATAKNTFQMLNERLTTAAQVRYYFPGVLTLLEDITNSQPDRAVALRNKLSEAKLPANTPNLGPQVAARCREATALIARTKLIPKEAPQPAQVRLYFAATEYYPEGNPDISLL